MILMLLRTDGFSSSSGTIDVGLRPAMQTSRQWRKLSTGKIGETNRVLHYHAHGDEGKRLWIELYNGIEAEQGPARPLEDADVSRRAAPRRDHRALRAGRPHQRRGLPCLCRADPG